MREPDYEKPFVFRKAFTFSPPTTRHVHLVYPDVPIYGQGFAAPSVRKDLYAGYPLADPAILTSECCNLCNGGEGQNHTHCKMEGLLQKATITGRWDTSITGNTARRSVICFSWQLQGSAARENGPKGACLGSVGDAGARKPTSSSHMIPWEKIVIDATDQKRDMTLVHRFPTESKSF
jgi:hypothetical protein